MKKLLGFLFIVLVLYSIYNDFTRGSLLAAGNENKTVTKTVHAPVQEKQESKENIPYFEKEISPGDTVLSVLESEHSEPIPVPISEVVADFKKLNEDVSPEDIKYGRSYKFPDYHAEQ